MNDILQNKYDMTMWQGGTFGLTITVKSANGAVQNLTNYTARMQVRSTYDTGTIAESLTTSNGEITIDGPNGNLTLALSATRTANLAVDLSQEVGCTPPKTDYVYDLELVSSSNVVSKLLFGEVWVYGEVTR